MHNGRLQQGNATIPARKRRQDASSSVPSSMQAWPDIEEDDTYYRPPSMPRSARRYVNTEGHEVIEQGKKRLVIQRQPPPGKHHLLYFIGLGMLAMLLLFLISNWAVMSWQTHQVNTTYGYPRTWQTDAVVGQNDSQEHPSHFIFLNLHGHVVVIEMPGGDITHARIYAGPTLFGPNADTIPITGEFVDINGDGKPDMVIHIQEQTIVFLNDGTQFKTQQ